MPYFVEIPLSDGEIVIAEVTGQVDDLAPVGRRRGQIVGRLPGALGDGLDRIQAFAGEVLSRMRAHHEPPDRVSVEFGLTFSAKAGVYIAESAAEAHLTITAEWSRSAADPTSRARNNPSVAASDPSPSAPLADEARESPPSGAGDPGADSG